MPLLGKRKYIDEKIGQLISKLDNLGYDTEEIKDVFYERTRQEQITEDDSLDDLSSGSILPYRNRINKTLSLIENLIKNNRNDSEDMSFDGTLSIAQSDNFNDTLPLAQSDNFIKDILKETILSKHQNNQPLSQYDLMN